MAYLSLAIYSTLMSLMACYLSYTPEDLKWLKIVHTAFWKAHTAIEKRKCVNTFWRQYGVDGEKNKAYIYDKRRDDGHQPWLLEFGDLALEATFQLSKLSDGKPIDEVLELPIVKNQARWALCPHGSKSYYCRKYSKKYRTFDGICNNKRNAEWGSALTTQRRFLPAVYSDYVRAPRKSVSGGDLPSARYISNKVFQGMGSDTPTQGFNTLLNMCWGQFLDHDFTLTPVTPGDEYTTITCCHDDKPADRMECLPISVPDDDPKFTDKKCLPFVRSAPAPQVDKCSLGPKQVLNELTSFIDASNVYGSSSKQATQLRKKTDGKLNVRIFDDDTIMLAENTSPESVCDIPEGDPNTYCQVAGDSRVNEQPGLGGMHLLFVREHQRIVKELKAKQPTWSDDILYLEARKIVGALMQQITYGEYLPLVLTDDVRNNNGLKLLDDGFSTDYDPTLDPTIRNEFAVGVFRFGHSQIPDGLGYLLQDFNTIQEDTPLQDLFLDPKLLVTNGGSKVVDLARFIITEEAQKVDRFFESSIRNTLFGITDLTSLNIQRGRDHGVAPYTEYRRYCGLSVPTNFDELTDHPESTRQVLKDAYNDEIEDIDLFVAGVSEIPMSDRTFLGPTFSCLLSEQFRALKVGDRFWYEREGPGGFTEDQLNEIRKVKMSKIMCNNFGFEDVQPDVFHQPTGSNTRVPCDGLPDMSFDPWAEPN